MGQLCYERGPPGDRAAFKKGCELARRREVKDKRVGKRRPGGRVQKVSQLDRTVRVEASIHERSIRIDSIARGTLCHVEHVFQARNLQDVADCMCG